MVKNVHFKNNLRIVAVGRFQCSPRQLEDDQSTADVSTSPQYSIGSSRSMTTIVDEGMKSKIDELAAQVSTLIYYISMFHYV